MRSAVLLTKGIIIFLPIAGFFAGHAAKFLKRWAWKPLRPPSRPWHTYPVRLQILSDFTKPFSPTVPLGGEEAESPLETDEGSPHLSKASIVQGGTERFGFLPFLQGLHCNLGAKALWQRFERRSTGQFGHKCHHGIRQVLSTPCKIHSGLPGAEMDVELFRKPFLSLDAKELQMPGF